MSARFLTESQATERFYAAHSSRDAMSALLLAQTSANQHLRHFSAVIES